MTVTAATTTASTDEWYPAPTKARWVDRWIRASRIPLRFQGTSLSDIITPVTNATNESEKYILGWYDSVVNGQIVEAKDSPTCGMGLLLTGAPGVGKTTVACALGMDLLLTPPTSFWGRDTPSLTSPVMYLTYPQYMRILGDSMDTDDEDRRFVAKRTLRRINGEGVHVADDVVKVLILDDLGKEYGTAWSKDQFDHLTRIRYDLALPTIVTSNVRLGEWAATYGEAAADFAKEAFLLVEMMGASRR